MKFSQMLMIYNYANTRQEAFIDNKCIERRIFLHFLILAIKKQN